jgi:hypothetical protein
MTCRIAHDPQLLRIKVRWLVRGDRCPEGDGAFDSRIDVIDGDLQMKHLRLAP